MYRHFVADTAKASRRRPPSNFHHSRFRARRAQARMEDDDADTVLMLVEAFEQQDSDVCDVRREVFHVLCLDSPSYSAWMMLYTYGNDINFLNATSLTRCDPTCCCRATALLTRVAPSAWRLPSPPSTLSKTLRRADEELGAALKDYAPTRISWPSPARQIELAKRVEAREPLLTHTSGFIDEKNVRVSAAASFIWM
ncbi:hypothetical protein GQ600_27772 [Phytophthora cactorum]|nr:hypothetical protein GQ600_27772 [Phytophthora cactorum]